jgi:hypothetical protein
MLAYRYIKVCVIDGSVSVEQCSCEANSRSASQGIPRISWKQKVHYRARKSRPLILIMVQVTQLHTFLPFF